jgi:hypothetical protein
MAFQGAVCGAVGEWLSLVEHLVRDQGVGGSNPLSPTIYSLALSIVYAAFCASAFSAIFGTLNACGLAAGYVYAAFFCSAFAFDQRAFCAAAIFLRLAAEIVRFGLSDAADLFFAQRAFCLRLIAFRSASVHW